MYEKTLILKKKGIHATIQIKQFQEKRATDVRPDTGRGEEQ